MHGREEEGKLVSNQIFHLWLLLLLLNWLENVAIHGGSVLYGERLLHFLSNQYLCHSNDIYPFQRHFFCPLILLLLLNT